MSSNKKNFKKGEREREEEERNTPHTSHHLPRNIRIQHAQELGLGEVAEDPQGSHDAGVREEDVEPPVPRHGVGDQVPHPGLVRRVQPPRVHLDSGEPRGDLPPVRLQVRRVEVADVDRARPVLRELVRCCAADAQGRVGAFFFINGGRNC